MFITGVTHACICLNNIKALRVDRFSQSFRREFHEQFKSLMYCWWVVLRPRQNLLVCASQRLNETPVFQFKIAINLILNFY